MTVETPAVVFGSDSGHSGVDLARLDAALMDVATTGKWPAGVIAALRERLIDGADGALFRINPYEYAAQHTLESKVSIELFIHATRAGLFTQEWGLVCRGCGEVVESHQRLSALTDHFFCAACAQTRTANLDEQVEVSFTVHPSIRRIRFHDLDSLSIEQRFFDWRFSRNIEVKGVGESLSDYIRDRTTVAAQLASDESVDVSFDATPGWIVGSPRAMITVEGEPTTEVREIALEHRVDQWLPRPTVRPGPVHLTLTNRSASDLPILLYHTPIVTYFEYREFLSGHRLLNDPEFRRQLGTEVVRPGCGLPLKDNTLLFTDLRGSTELYDRVGDERAFAVVSQHFECLARVVTRWSGVVVKTMGDAVMASFSRPENAVCAAIAMLDEMKVLPELVEGADMAPKVGVHRGPCIAVTVANAIDFFGHTVNVAARTQGRASAGELCITDAVYTDPNVIAVLAGRPHTEERIQLRGVDSELGLLRIRSQAIRLAE
ncbi:MAG: class 3 adenylate cyclase [Myxococcota bacterium]|jgi:class 3 adenylate cyclase